MTARGARHKVLWRTPNPNCFGFRLLVSGSYLRMTSSQDVSFGGCVRRTTLVAVQAVQQEGARTCGRWRGLLTREFRRCDLLCGVMIVAGCNLPEASW